MGTRDEHARTRANGLRRTHNPLVAGSSPARPTSEIGIELSFVAVLWS